MREAKPFYNFYQIYKYMFFFPLLALSTALLGSLAVITAITTGPKIGSLMGVIWARFNSLITPMSVVVSGKKNINKKQSYIVVANHQSQYDIFVIYGWLPVDFKWVMKKQLRSIPFLGYACYKIGHIYIDRSNPMAAIDSINSAKEKIKEGTSIMFFPEGHRSENGNLQEFKKGAFKFAIDMQLPVLPVTIIGTGEILPSNTTKLFPGHAKLIINEPINIENYNDSNIDELITKTRKSIQKTLQGNT